MFVPLVLLDFFRTIIVDVLKMSYKGNAVMRKVQAMGNFCLTHRSGNSSKICGEIGETKHIQQRSRDDKNMDLCADFLR